MKPFCLTKQHFTNYLPQYICQTKSTYGSTKHENKNKLLKNYGKAPTKSQSDLNKDIFFSSSFLNQENHIIIFNVTKMNSNTLSDDENIRTHICDFKIFHKYHHLKYCRPHHHFAHFISVSILCFSLYCVFLLYELS